MIYEGHRIKVKEERAHHFRAYAYAEDDLDQCAWRDTKTHAYSDLAEESARKWIANAPYCIHRGFRVVVQATGTNEGYSARVYRDRRMWAALDYPRATRRAALEAGKALVEKLRFRVLRPGCASYADAETYEEAKRLREEAIRVCGPSYVIGRRDA